MSNIAVNPRPARALLFGAPVLDRFSMVSWALVLAPAAIFAAILASGAYRIVDRDLLLAIGSLAAIGLCGVFLCARGWVRAGLIIECYTLFSASSLLASLLSIPLAATAFPLRDQDLADIDRALFGIDWAGMAMAANQSASLMKLLSHAYASLMQQPFVLLIGLLALGRMRTARLFILAWMVALGFCLAIFPFVPALGGYLHFGIAQSETHVLAPAAWRHIEIFEPARAGALRLIGLAHLEGVITFPSFHAAAAVLIGWAAFSLPFVRWPALGLNAVMLASTPLIGGHYLVDVIAGCLIAAVSIGIAKRVAGPLSAASPGLRDAQWSGEGVIGLLSMRLSSMRLSSWFGLRQAS